MKRRLVTLAAAASLLLCAATVALGLMGLREGGVEASWYRGTENVVLFSDGGVLSVVRSRGWPDPSWVDNTVRRNASVLRSVSSNWLVVDTIREDVVVSDAQRSAQIVYHEVRTNVPYAILLTGMLPGVWCIAWRAGASRTSFGSCAACGYDLRATPARCPECGAVPAAPAAR